ncbi:DUF2254 domain-containing protein [Sneathiella sp. HT1-7]|uniref:DUF2254 domain-containing protein n=1 Tax=Sneathiella sp. HT1-7 TaxID=2887192 RepID=UPI001D14A29D|nr:DUF2254 domain-containing protein [Sneathiella sp. HT1-7]MCC3305541.1 DUF2254 domain-containing protein [Sneathiella sp. HT1-7]
MNFAFLRHPFVMLQTIPAGIALSIGAFALVIGYGESFWSLRALDPYLQDLAPETARTILSVIAGGAMSALTLTYSIVLVVFALAAGNLAPRMLKRFTSDIVNQVTAGIFGGTFIYALLATTFVKSDFVPNLTILGAEVLATLCVMQLIYFVRNVSESVAIDDEIAAITKKLKAALDARNKSRGEEENKERKKAVEKVDDFVFDITAGKPGYLGSLNEDKLTEIATKADVTLEIQKARGAYTLGEEVMIKATKELDEDTVDSIQKQISIRPSRSEDSPIEFSVNLLLEIALRALSPGVNDTYTAIATVDGISDALSQADTQEAATASIHKDEEGNIRLMIPQLSIGNLINQAFHPLRQASGGNILMAICIARAYARLCATCGKGVQNLLTEHALLLIREVEKSNQLPEDIESVVEVLPPAIRKAVREQQEKGAK